MDPQGRLTVRVITSRAQIPVAGATVVVTRRTEGGKYELLSIQQSDESGATRTVTVATPPRSESTHPNQGEVPFTPCDVWAEHPGFALLLVTGVQVFPGEETLQSMVLTPLSEGQTSLGTAQRQETPVQNL